MRGTLETKRKSNDYLICCKEWCAGAWTVKWTGSWNNLDKWQLCTCRWGHLLLLGIQQPKQNIPSYLAISLEDIIHNTLIWSFLNKMCNIVLRLFIDNCSNSYVFMWGNIYCLLSTLPHVHFCPIYFDSGCLVTSDRYRFNSNQFDNAKHY